MMKMTKLSYFEKRVANNQWQVFNEAEETYAEIIEVYDRVTRNIVDELLALSEEIELKDLTRSRAYQLKHLRQLEEYYIEELAKLGQVVEKTYTETLENAINSTIINTSTELGIKLTADTNVVKKLMKSKYKGVTFRGRLGNNNAKLIKELSEILERGLTTGKSITQMTLQLRNRMNSNLNDTMRLVRTETMHHLNDIKLQNYKKSKVVKQLKDVVTLDERTSEQCADCAGNIYDIDKAPTLPRHPNCRCVLVPYFDEDKI